MEKEPECRSTEKNRGNTGRLILVTGGSGSGKSAFAEDRLTALAGARRKFYIATMYPYDEESHRRIDRHRRLRAGKGFETVERYTNLAEIPVPGGCGVLLECMSNLVANEMFLPGGAGENTVAQVLSGVENLCARADVVVIVTNEIFSEAMAYQDDTERYQRYLGAINCRLAAQADEVVEVVFGIPVYQKGKQECPAKEGDGL